MMHQQGYNIEYVNGEIIVMKTPPKHNDVYELPYNLEHLKLLLISDTHLASKYDRLDILKYLYDKAEKMGLNIYCTLEISQMVVRIDQSKYMN